MVVACAVAILPYFFLINDSNLGIVNGHSKYGSNILFARRTKKENWFPGLIE